jgi:hypothetical protein
MFFKNPTTVPLYIIFGESNSGGIAPNADIPIAELTPNPWTRIWNPDSQAIEPLQIGHNNSLGHTGISGIYPNVHGLERGIARFAVPRKPLFIVKAGHGGSLITQWLSDSPQGYWEIFVKRCTQSMAAIRAQGYSPVPLPLWWQGINDAVTPLSSAAWAAATTAHLQRVRSFLRCNKIYMPLLPLQPRFAAYNQAISDMAVRQTVSAIVLPPNPKDLLPDATHYSASGFLNMATALETRLLADNISN